MRADFRQPARDVMRSAVCFGVRVAFALVVVGSYPGVKVMGDDGTKTLRAISEARRDWRQRSHFLA